MGECYPGLAEGLAEFLPDLERLRPAYSEHSIRALHRWLEEAMGPAAA